MLKNPAFKWIPVTEALPKNSERVLVVCVNRENHAQRHVTICEYWGDQGHLSPLYRWSGNKLVSHWAPLPELPEDNPVYVLRKSGMESTTVIGLEGLRDVLKTMVPDTVEIKLERK